jgi:hypothetical protein
VLQRLREGLPVRNLRNSIAPQARRGQVNHRFG